NFSLSPGDDFSFSISDNFPGGTGSMSATVTSPALVTPFDAPGVVQISGGTGPITHPGTYHGTFSFNGEVDMAPLSAVLANPKAGCFTNPVFLPCSLEGFQGEGTLTIDFVAGGNGQFDADQATLTFTTPEPSTTSLLLLGVAGLVVSAVCRRSRATLLP